MAEPTTLALRREGWSVAALAARAAVVGDGAEAPFGEGVREPLRIVRRRERPVDDDDGIAGARLEDRDRSAVGRGDLSHEAMKPGASDTGKRPAEPPRRRSVKA